jgi:hypothetical protein
VYRRSDTLAPPHTLSAYDETSAARREKELKTAGCAEVGIVPVTPGQLPEPGA